LIKRLGIAALFWALGHAPTLYLANPAFGVALAVLAIIPLGSKSASYPVALFRGVVLGIFAGIGVASALQIRYPDATALYLAVYIMLTIVMCTAAALLYAYLAQRRRRIIDQQWQ